VRCAGLRAMSQRAVIVKPALRVGALGDLRLRKRPDPRSIREGQADYQRIESMGNCGAPDCRSTHTRFDLLLGNQAVECILLASPGPSSTFGPERMWPSGAGRNG